MPDVDDEYALDFMAWQVAEGVPSEIDWVMRNLSYYECLKVLMMRRYDSYIQDKIMKASTNG